LESNHRAGNAYCFSAARFVVIASRTPIAPAAGDCGHPHRRLSPDPSRVQTRLARDRPSRSDLASRVRMGREPGVGQQLRKAALPSLDGENDRHRPSANPAMEPSASIARDPNVFWSPPRLPRQGSGDPDRKRAAGRPGAMFPQIPLQPTTCGVRFCPWQRLSSATPAPICAN
jgi:hypothetical protein